MNDDLKAIPERIAEFLRMALPDGPFVLGAIPAAKGAPKVRTFDQAEEAAAWAETMNAAGAHNLYWIHNRLKGPVDRKPKEEDVSDVLFLHVDCDPPKKLPREDMSTEDLVEWNEAERERIVERLAAFNPEPTFLVDSGGGMQAFWRLDPAMYVDGDETLIGNIKPYNVGLRDVLGGDNCQSLDHLMRLPGTVNWPDAEKRKRGRVPRLAELIPASGRPYPLQDFKAAEPEVKVGKRKKSAAVAERGKVRRISDPAAELDQWNVLPWVPAVIIHGHNPEEPDRWDGDRSRAVFAVCCALVRCGVPAEVIVGIITDPTWGISAHVLAQRGSTLDYAWDQVENARADVAEAEHEAGGRRVINPAAPLKTARRLHRELWPTAMHTNSDWLEYRLGAYRDVEDATIKRDVYAALEEAVVRKETQGKVEIRPFNPDAASVSRVLDALKSVAHEPADRMAPPVWRDGEGPPPGEIISCRNGLLHVPSGKLLEPTPRFFTRNALDIDYTPDTPEPEEWLRFVREVFPDPAAAELLQDWFGYLLLPDTSQEKMLLMVGPPRSGKGTIQKVLTELIGRSNVCAPSISSLGKQFGLQPLIGKQVAFLSDIRVGRGADAEAITETLLRITGQDDVTADRKNKEAWTGRLAVRFVVSSNEPPRLRDNSPALANRFSPLIMERSHLGREDHGLAARLIEELPGILNWAIVGWRRLRERGHFVLPDASREAIDEIQDIGSPVAAFIRDRCVVDPAKSVPKEALYTAYRSWCDACGERAVSDNIFARDLRTATAQAVKDSRPAAQGNEKRVRVFTGIGLLGDEPQPEEGRDIYRREDPY